MNKSLAIVATHPIQYYAPIYRELAKTPGLELKVFYGKIPSAEEQGVQFNKAFNWDVDLLSGYSYSVGEEGSQELLKGMHDGKWMAVLAHGWFDPYSKRFVSEAFRNRVPVMVRGDSHLQTQRPLWKKILKYPVYRALLPKMAACLAVGTWSEDYYAYYGVPRAKIIRSSHCVDNEWFKKRAEELKPQRQALRKNWNIQDDSFVFLFAGRMSPMKRIPDFLAAFQGLQLKHRKVHALLVGDGPDFDRIKAVGAQFSNVTFTGFLNQTEIVKAYAASDVLVLPSNAEETWGLVVNEALCFDLKCVVSDQVGCSVDIILPGNNGLVYPCGDVEKLKGVMDEILEMGPDTPERAAQRKKILDRHACRSAVEGILTGLAKC